jgi:Protein of unknown function (DUF4007)
MTALTPYRISGDESFPCRYTWLPKAVRGLEDNPMLFSNDDQAMVDLGLGKNMVRSVRFWAHAAGMAAPVTKGGGYKPTDFGSALLGPDGLDPFLEDIRTLWLIHWKLSTNTRNPLLAWDFLLNCWQEPDLVPSAAQKALEKEAAKRDADLSPVTLEQHFRTFLHTYVPTRGWKGEVIEDNLDCPLVELELIVKISERPMDRTEGRMEPIYAFRREEKPEITSELFVYCLNDFWENRHASEKTLHFREVAHGHGSPGQIFKLPEEDVRARVEGLARQTKGTFTYAESANLQQIRRTSQKEATPLLNAIYRLEEANG